MSPIFNSPNPNTISPEQVLQALKDGNVRVMKDQRIKRDLHSQIAATALAQHPLAVILSCIDSRVPVEIVFDLGIGDVFSIRMAGNIISEKILGSLEFACLVAGAKLIVVMGHTGCGAINTALQKVRTGQAPYNESECRHLGTIISDIEKVINGDEVKAELQRKALSDEELQNFIVLANVRASIKAIKAQSKSLARAIDNHKIAIVGCVYDISNGAVLFF